MRTATTSLSHHKLLVTVSHVTHITKWSDVAKSITVSSWLLRLRIPLLAQQIDERLTYITLDYNLAILGCATS